MAKPFHDLIATLPTERQTEIAQRAEAILLRMALPELAQTDQLNQQPVGQFSGDEIILSQLFPDKQSSTLQ
jgi:hypothetical protein